PGGAADAPGPARAALGGSAAPGNGRRRDRGLRAGLAATSRRRDASVPPALGKSLLHNIGGVIVGFALAGLRRGSDLVIGVRELRSGFAIVAGGLLLGTGFLLRVWAAFHFYQRGLKVISLQPQAALITSGPFALSRNPLYLGGNVCILFGAALLLGSP